METEDDQGWLGSDITRGLIELVSVEDRGEACADQFGPEYPTIRARGIPEKLGVQGCPTQVMVDKAGKVCKIHVGYSPTLHDDLATLIRRLIAEEL